MRNELETLEAVAASWIGTPFCERSNVKGAGVACHALPAEILIAAAWLPRFKYPMANPAKAGLDFSDAFFLVDAAGLFEQVNSEPKPGDVLVFQLGRTTHFVLQLTGGNLIHVLLGGKVGIVPTLPATWQKRLVRIWRPRHG